MRTTTAATETAGMRRPPQKIPNPPPRAAESVSEYTEGSGRSLSMPPD